MGWATIRKFGLGHCDLPTMLWNVSVMLRVLTLNIDNRYTKKIPLAYYFISGTLAACFVYVFLISIAWFIIWRSRQIDDMVQTIVMASLGIASEIGTSKLIFMFFYRHEIRKLVDLYLACDSLVKPDSRFAANLMKILRRVKKRAIFFWLVIIGNGVIYVTKPFLLPGRHLMDDYFIVYGLEPKLESPNYEITMLLMIGASIFTCYLPANISAFFIITGYTEAQMTALTEEILQLWSDAQLHYHEQIAEVGGNDIIPYQGLQLRDVLEKKNKIINEYIKRRLYEIVKIHTTNINLLHLVENVYRGSIAAEFLLLTLSMIVELLGGLENTYLQIPFALIQVGMDCFCGQRIMDASAAFEHAVYACKWEMFDVPNMKTILIMLQMSQKTMQLSAGGVTMLSFQSLAGVIRIIYSGYTGLRQVTM